MATTLVFMGQTYAGQGRYLVLRVHLPAHPREEPKVIELRWNPTSGIVTTNVNPRIELARESLRVELLLGSDLMSPARTQPATPTISSVTTSALLEGERGEVVRQLQDKTGLP